MESPDAPGNAGDILDAASLQARIDEIQALYREWTAMQPRLEAAQQDWRRSITLMARLSAFCFEGEYRTCRQAIEAGVPVNLHTKGEYSIMSEDALWDAIGDHQAMAWQRLRSAIDVLDREGHDDRGP